MDIHEEVKELRKLWGSFWQARVLLTANNLRVFDYLQTPKSTPEISGLIKTDPRATEILLDAVAGLGLLEIKKQLSQLTDCQSPARYRHSLLPGRYPAPCRPSLDKLVEPR